jgi:hypothetical protein
MCTCEGCFAFVCLHVAAALPLAVQVCTSHKRFTIFTFCTALPACMLLSAPPDAISVLVPSTRTAQHSVTQRSSECDCSLFAGYMSLCDRWPDSERAVHTCSVNSNFAAMHGDIQCEELCRASVPQAVLGATTLPGGYLLQLGSTLEFEVLLLLFKLTRGCVTSVLWSPVVRQCGWQPCGLLGWQVHAAIVCCQARLLVCSSMIS